MRTVFISLIFICFSGMSIFGQTSPLLDYIEEGLDHNLVLQQKNLSLQRAMNALQVARSMYLPAIDLDVAYTHAKGGRSINLPVGDMLNPVYNTLNALTQSQAFPQIQNETINFLPQNYYDAKVRTVIPLINTDIAHNKQIKTDAVRLEESEIGIYKRELVKEIKEAYYRYISALEVEGIYKSSLELAHEGLRVNEKLLEAGKGLPAYVVRAKTEIAQIESQLAEAEKNIKNSSLYFNALLNRDADAFIEQDSTLFSEENWGLENGDEIDISQREELLALQTGIAMQESVLKMNKQYLVPKVSGFLDLGSQAEGLKFNRDSRYFMVGLTLSVPLFQGNRNRLKMEETKIDLAETWNRKAQAEQQLTLAAKVARNGVLAARKNYEKSKTQLEAASTYQRLIQRGYNEGVNSYMEAIDARSQYTAAKLSVNISQLQVLAALAKLERESATFQIPQP
ncbi:TolC family protein [Sphingobacterium corticibacterium]|uniref:TolC family protein n=1 Tax=Sphingobacterium corticibacterium TaxID=2484746 RepID=A0A4V2DCU6_9SPHI|nr:TolC family protein [Sphingobacterium corticibacterium]RZF62718.1 TolC family protein [Sphingobacterium corticibacterium]